MEAKKQRCPKKVEFIDLRATGHSFNKITKKLKVSKSTLIEWSRELSDEINNAKALVLESIREEYLLGHEHRIRIMGAKLNKITQEIFQRDLSDVPTWRLFEIERKMIDQIAKNDIKIEFSETLPCNSIEALTSLLNKTIKWTA